MHHTYSNIITKNLLLNVYENYWKGMRKNIWITQNLKQAILFVESIFGSILHTGVLF